MQTDPLACAPRIVAYLLGLAVSDVLLPFFAFFFFLVFLLMLLLEPVVLPLAAALPARWNHP